MRAWASRQPLVVSLQLGQEGVEDLPLLDHFEYVVGCSVRARVLGLLPCDAHCVEHHLHRAQVEQSVVDLDAEHIAVEEVRPGGVALQELAIEGDAVSGEVYPRGQRADVDAG